MSDVKIIPGEMCFPTGESIDNLSTKPKNLSTRKGPMLRISKAYRENYDRIFHVPMEAQGARETLETASAAFKPNYSGVIRHIQRGSSE